MGLTRNPGRVHTSVMQLTSPDFSAGGELPWTMSAANENRLPTLEISDVPADAITLALMLEDLDSPVGPITHWLLWNLPPDTRRLDALSAPRAGRLGMSGFGKVGYSGPKPPEGRHSYRFTLLALSLRLDLAEGATRKQFDAAIRGHVIDTASLEGSIERTNSGGR